MEEISLWFCFINILMTLKKRWCNPQFIFFNRSKLSSRILIIFITARKILLTRKGIRNYSRFSFYCYFFVNNFFVILLPVSKDKSSNSSMMNHSSIRSPGESKKCLNCWFAIINCLKKSVAKNQYSFCYSFVRMKYIFELL
jgi:hypothetical protein